jgi:trimeric autotransporter adhesin
VIDLNKKLRGVMLVLAMLLLAVGAKAQSNYGAIRGSVTDSQGATLTRATVVLTSEATKSSRQTIVNGAG